MIAKICIFGAGAIGGWIGMCLARSSSQINMIARGATLATLRRDGLTLIETHNGRDVRERKQVNAVQDPAELGRQDLVVVAVKAPAMVAVAKQIGPLIGPATMVLTAMNGVPWWFLAGGFGGRLAGRQLYSVDPEGKIAAAIPERNVVGGVVHTSCSIDAPGVIRHHSGNGLIVGEPSGKITPRVERLVELLVLCGVEASASRQIQKDAWYKLWGNMTVNPISALTGATIDKIVEDDLMREFIANVMREAKAIGECLGITTGESPEGRLELTRKLGAFKTSMLQDVEAGRPVELDALVSAVRELGQSAGVSTPYTDTLLALARVHARQRGLYLHIPGMVIRCSRRW